MDPVQKLPELKGILRRCLDLGPQVFQIREVLFFLSFSFFVFFFSYSFSLFDREPPSPVPIGQEAALLYHFLSGAD